MIVTPDGKSDVFTDVHVVSFPSLQAFAAYRSDERVGQMAHLRQESVIDTQLLIGEEGPITYGANGQHPAGKAREAARPGAQGLGRKP